MQRRKTALFTAVLMTLSIIFSQFVFASKVNAAASDLMTFKYDVQCRQTQARAMLDTMNKWRVKDHECWEEGNTSKTIMNGGKALIYDDELEQIALQRATEIIFYFEHTRPNGQKFSTVEYNGIRSNGENILAGAIGAFVDKDHPEKTYTDVAFEYWVEEDELYDKQGHRRNMLKKEYTHVGIACVEYNGAFYWVQEFGIFSDSRKVNGSKPNDSTMTVETQISNSVVPETIGLPFAGYNITDFANYGVPHTLYMYDNFQVCKRRGDLLVEDITDDSEIHWNLVDGNGKIYNDKYDYDKATLTFHLIGTYKLTGTVTYNGVTMDIGNTTTIKISPTYINDSNVVATYDKVVEYSDEPGLPKVKLENNGEVLVEGVDYTLEYHNYNFIGNYGYIQVNAIGEHYQSYDILYFEVVPADISRAEVDNVVDKTYTGVAQIQAPVVTINGKTLTTSNYSITYKDNVDAGTATMVIAGKNKYTGTKEVEFKINPCDIADAEISGITPSVNYTGDEINPVPSVKISGRVLTADKDYEVEYKDNVIPGTAKVIINGKGNYTGSCTETFLINALNLYNAKLSIDKKIYPYNGHAVEPEPVVTVGDKTLVKDVDYTVSYNNNEKKGTASVVVTGIGGYKGTLTETFTITPANISAATVEGILASYSLNGDAVEPVPVVTFGDVPLKLGVDYSVAYQNNTEPGTATVVISGIGNYTGKISVDFEIAAYEIDDCEVLNIPGMVMFTGAAIEPSITVKYGDEVLVEGEDYIYTVTNNVTPGIATVVITGKGSYSGEKKISFIITKGDIDLCEVNGDTTVMYSGSEICPELEVVSTSGVVLKEDVDYTVKYENNLNAGKGTATITGINNYNGEKVYYFTITAVTNDLLTVEGIPSSVEFTGDAINPVPVISYGDLVLTEGKDYTVVYGENTDIGKGMVEIILSGNYSGKIYKLFDITPISIAEATISGFDEEVTFTGNAIEPDVQVAIGDMLLVRDTDYTVEFKDNSGVGTATIVVTGTGVYEGTIEASFRIIRGSVADANLYGIPKLITYTGEAIEPEFFLVNDSGILKADVDYTYEFKDNVNAGEATIIVTGIGDYAGTLEKTFTIQTADFTKATIADIDDVEYTGSAVEVSPDIRFGEITLVEGVDYDVEQSENILPGTAKIVVTGKGNFSGKLTKEFTIVEAEISSAVISGVDASYEHTGDAIYVTPVVVHNGTTLKQNVDYLVSYSKNVDVGEASVIITGVGNYRGTTSVKFNITASSISKATVESVPQTAVYTGSAIKFTPVVKFGGETLVEGKDYKVSYENNVNKGNAKLVIKGINNYSGELKVAFSIVPASIIGAQIGTVNPVVYSKSGAKVTPSITLGGKTLVKDKDYKFVYSNNKKVGEATATVVGIGNYEGEVNFKYTIVPLKIEGRNLTNFPTEIAYTGSAIEFTPTLTSEGAALNYKTDFDIVFKNNVNVGTATAVITGKGNYTGTITRTFSITKASISRGKVAAIGDQLYTGSAIKPSVKLTVNGRTLVNGKDYKIQYKNNVNVGTASIVITGIGSYRDSITVNFKIYKKQSGGVQGFCERLYTCALGRASDPAGVKSWVDAIRDGATGAQAAKGFFFSDEFISKKLSNTEYVTRLYKTFMDREPDAAGLKAWVDALNGGASREDVFNGFVNSQEWANICFKYGIKSGGTAKPNVRVEPSPEILAFAERLYTTCLGRKADPSGLKSWATALANREGSGAKVAHGFFFSDEFIGKNLDNGEFVRRCYLTFMDREPDAGGYEAWVGALNAGATREQVFNGFTQSPEFVALCEKAGIIAY